jgi:hypothetical protein
MSHTTVQFGPKDHRGMERKELATQRWDRLTHSWQELMGAWGPQVCDAEVTLWAGVGG